jgi:UDP-GlcNAc:undecaprenyl-phosphate GlcNAc-1-phosphate transferase
MSEYFWTPLFKNAFIFGYAFVLSSFLVWVAMKLSHQYGFLDLPDDRKRHTKPMPLLGGAALFVSFWAVVFSGIGAAFFLGRGIFNIEWPVLTRILSLIPKVMTIFWGSLVIFLTGLIDDKFTLSPLQKLIGQALAVFILLHSGLAINFVQNLGAWGDVVTFLWVLLIINAFNFIDSLDGHCAGVALISALVFFWITQIISQSMVGFFLMTFAGVLAGFLIRNFRPASIFLGDNGSQFIGYMLSAFTLLCRYQGEQAHYITSMIPVLIFGVPIYDTASVIVVRLLRGTAPWKGDRNHFAHRLVKMGMSDRIAVIFSYFISVTLGLVAISTTQVSSFGAILVGLIFMSIIGVIAFLEVYATRRQQVMEKLARFKAHRDAVVQEKRPWGAYESLAKGHDFQSKKIQLSPGLRFSLQKHAQREERWIIVRGQGMVTVGKKEWPVGRGSYVEVPRGSIHRLHNTGNEPLILIEVQLGDYLGEDDITRLEDDFGRIEKP